MAERIEIPETFPQPGDVSGRRVVITGGGRGLGEVIAQSQHLTVSEVALDRRDQVVALAEDRDRHPGCYLSSETVMPLDSGR